MLLCCGGFNFLSYNSFVKTLLFIFYYLLLLIYLIYPIVYKYHTVSRSKDVSIQNTSRDFLHYKINQFRQKIPIYPRRNLLGEGRQRGAEKGQAISPRLPGLPPPLAPDAIRPLAG